MTRRERLTHQIDEATTRWQRLSLLAGKLKLSRDLETRPDERLRIEARLAEVEADRAAATTDLDALDKQLADLPAAPGPQERAAPTSPLVFWSYAHEDEPLRDDLARHVEALDVGVQHWHDRLLRPGQERGSTLAAQIKEASVIVVLASSDYLANDELVCEQLGPALARHQAGEAIVLPVILRACSVDVSPLAKLEVLPKDGLPVTSWPDRDMIIRDVAQRIHAVLSGLKLR